MKKSFLLGCFLSGIICIGRSQQQKPAISVLNNWPSLGMVAMSNNGQYAIYTINNYPAGRNALIIQSTDNRWQLNIPGGSDIITSKITPDNQRCIFITSNDSLGICILGTSTIDYIPAVKHFKMSGRAASEHIAYFINGSNNLILRNLLTNQIHQFNDVTEYAFSDDGEILTLISGTENPLKKKRLLSVDVAKGNKADTLWEGIAIRNVIVSRDHQHIAFVGQSSADGDMAIWHYPSTMGQTRRLIGENELDSTQKIERLLPFDANNDKILFSTIATPIIIQKRNFVSVDVWSYFDTKLQSRQLKAPNSLQVYHYALQLHDHTLIRLNEADDIVTKIGKDYVLITRKNGDFDASEFFSNPLNKHSIVLVAIRDGSRKVILADSRFYCELSPNEKFIIYYNYIEQNFHTYEIATGIFKNITVGISTNWRIFDSESPHSKYGSTGWAGWLENDTAVLIQDQYDIWQVDPRGIKPPVNLTNGYGQRNAISFRLCAYRQDQTIDSNEPLLLSAFNRSNKQNGFYEKRVTIKGDPRKLLMGDYVFYMPENHLGFQPIKAAHASSYIIRRESASAFPNYFFTKDFAQLTPVSAIYPEKEYDWLTTELVRWKSLDGKITDGVLYKPSSFDSTKKYPIIFNYYNKKSHLLHAYLPFQPCDGDINIPWFVSQGYLVFTPDIHFKTGYTGESVVNAVVAAASYLSKKSWVNSRKMGIQGFSFGGYHTNYLVSHTGIFAAAMTGAGISNLLSIYGGINAESGAGNQEYFELSGIGMGVKLWDAPQRYIDNSPIFKADKVTTPLLIMNNKRDAAVDFSQAVDFFTALRRLGKKVWLLQYDDGGHGVWGDIAIDYTIRMTQFFNFYLQDHPAPRWMSQGIKASAKGIDDGLSLDTIVPPQAFFK
jgi:dipeptidyl aminopeptidase/acylaminoacyl peptidase